MAVVTKTNQQISVNKRGRFARKKNLAVIRRLRLQGIAIAWLVFPHTGERTGSVAKMCEWVWLNGAFKSSIARRDVGLTSVSDRTCCC